MRDPEMYNYVRQVLETMRDSNMDLDHALGMHGNNMTEEEVREIIAEKRAHRSPYDGIREKADDDTWEL